jgi:hypothetical protein
MQQLLYLQDVKVVGVYQVGIFNMNDTLNIIQPPQKIRIETPIGSIETLDDSPIMDGSIVVLVFAAFCFYVYSKYFRKKK